MDPLTLGLVTSAAAPLLFRAFAGGPPKPPDIISPVAAGFERQRATLGREADRRVDRVRANAAARGLSSSATAGELDRVQRGSNEALIDLSAAEAESLANARNQAMMNRFQHDSQGYLNRAQGVSDIAGMINQYVTMQSLLENSPNALGRGAGVTNPGGGFLKDNPSLSDLFSQKFLMGNL